MNATMTQTTLHVNDGGSGDLPIVFLHSLAGSSSHWQGQLSHVRKQRRAIAIDLLGHGQSATPEIFTLESMADAVAQTLAHLEIEQVLLVGHSMGGAVANKFIGRYPNKVAGVVLVDAAGDSTQIPEVHLTGFLQALNSPAYSDVIRGYWQEMIEESEAEIQAQLLTELADMPQTTVASILHELVRYNPLPDLARLDGSALLVTTRHSDSPFSLHALRPDIPHVRIEGTSHWLQLDKPAEFNAILDNFLLTF